MAIHDTIKAMFRSDHRFTIKVNHRTLQNLRDAAPSAQPDWIGFVDGDTPKLIHPWGEFILLEDHI